MTLPAFALAVVVAAVAAASVAADAQAPDAGPEPAAAAGYEPSTATGSRTGTGHGALLGARPTEYPDWFKQSFLDIEEDVGEAREAGRRVIVFFHQDGCPYCNALIEKTFSRKDIEADVRAHFDVVAMNMWGDREVLSLGSRTFTEKTFSAALEVQFTPTLVFLGDRGEPVLRLNGYLPAPEFRTAIDFVKDGHYRKTTFREFARAAEGRPDRQPPPAPAGSAAISGPSFMPPPYVLARGPGAKPLAVFFERPDCARCEALHRGPLADEETHGLLARFDAVRLDAWSDTPVTVPSGERMTARAWAGRLGVSYLPTIVFFDPRGVEVIRSEAFFKTFHTQSMMDYVLSGAWREEPSFQRYISARADGIRARGRDVDIWR